VEAIFFVPGYSGSELWDENFGIWPPDFPDVILGYRRMTSLSRPTGLRVGKIIRDVCSMDIHRTFLAEMADIARARRAKFIEVPYDWRISVHQSVQTLTAAVRAWGERSDVDRITIVAHSMGGMLARRLVENRGSGAVPPWQRKITRLLCICTPHLGAPRALSQSLGLETQSTVRPADVKAFAANPNFAAGYGLLTRSDRPVLFEKRGGSTVPLDFYDPRIARKFGLGGGNLRDATSVHQALDGALPATDVEYRYFYATGHITDVYVTVEGGRKTVTFDRNGDGSVPTWSITEPARRHGIATWNGPGDHVDVLHTRGLINAVRAFFGLAPRAVRTRRGKAAVVVSINQLAFLPGEEMSILLIPDDPEYEGTATVILSRWDEGKRAFVPIGRTLVAMKRTRLGAARRSTKAPMVPGLYRYSVTGDLTSAATRTGVFAVTPRRAPRRRR
jgi:pimeloyl-ACP methyl ester carboxylesterase